MAEQQPRIVAELGRPETPEETAARKAETSRKHRSNQTVLNLVVALVASLGIVLFLVVVVVRPTPSAAPAIDYASIGADAQQSTSQPLVIPALPAGWSANNAEFGKKSEVLDWYIGFVTPSTQFVAFDQGIDANATWLAAQLNNSKSTGSTTIDGLSWLVYDRRSESNTGNYNYSMSAIVGSSTIVLHGTAPTSEFELLAASIAADHPHSQTDGN
ncbi:MAG: DUF4245 domain-containing protein [Rhodoglobus sp.]